MPLMPRGPTPTACAFVGPCGPGSLRSLQGADYLIEHLLCLSAAGPHRRLAIVQIGNNLFRRQAATSSARSSVRAHSSFACLSSACRLAADGGGPGSLRSLQGADYLIEHLLCLSAAGPPKSFNGDGTPPPSPAASPASRRRGS